MGIELLLASTVVYTIAMKHYDANINWETDFTTAVMSGISPGLNMSTLSGF